VSPIQKDVVEARRLTIEIVKSETDEAVCDWEHFRLGELAHFATLMVAGKVGKVAEDKVELAVNEILRGDLDARVADVAPDRGQHPTPFASSPGDPRV
jgi:hypothetical protein